MKITQKNKMLEEFLKKNGCGIKLDFDHNTIVIPDGGLWGVNKEIIKIPVIKGYKKVPNKGYYEIISYPKRKQKSEEFDVIIWFEELRETINYLIRLEKLLKDMGYETTKSIRRKKNEI